MNDPTPRRPLEDWVRTAHDERPDCPPREQLHQLVVDADSVHADRLREHLQACRECALDYEMAAVFESAAPKGAESAVAAIVKKLEATSPAPSTRRASIRAAGVGRLLGWMGTLPRWQLGVLATAALALALMTWPQPPELPIAHQSTLRGSTVLPIQPVGELDLPPTELAWHAHGQAVTYRVRVLAVDDAVLWEQTVALPRTDLPMAIREQLQPYVRYVWTIEALGDSGTPVAVSEAQSFRIVPAQPRN